MSDAAILTKVDADPGPVIAAISFDERGRQCLIQALRRAAHTAQPVIALHVLHESGRTMGLYRRHDRGEVLRPNADVASRLLADFSAEIIAGEPGAAGTPLRQLVVAGVPERRIAEVARLTGAELIIMGRRLQTGLQRLLRRNTALTVLRRAPCPVLVVDGDGNALDTQDLRRARRDRAWPTAVETR